MFHFHLQASRHPGRRLKKSPGTVDDRESLAGSIGSSNSKRRSSRYQATSSTKSTPQSSKCDKRKNILEDAIKNIYNDIRQKYTLEKWGRVAVIYRKNDTLITKQCKAFASSCWRNASVVTAPVEIPQLCNQLGHFEAKINGHFAHVGVNIIPVVGLNLALLFRLDKQR